MELTLEETMKRVDYKLKYRFNYCRICEAKGLDPHVTTNIYIHDFDDSGHNINHYHGQLGTKECHIEKPMKYCTKCNRIYNHDEYICVFCQKTVDERTKLELTVEDCDKRMSKVLRLKGKKKYNSKESQDMLEACEKIKKESLLKLGNLS